MPSLARHRAGRHRLTAALILAAAATSGHAWAQALPAPTALERANGLLRAREFEQAVGVLRQVLTANPADRRAREMLAFALESLGDVDGERQVRAALAEEFPDDARLQVDYGRVLERSGRESGALAAYRRARELTVGKPDPELQAAIDRMEGRTAIEVGTPLTAFSDPAASGYRAQAGAAMPFGPGRHLALLATHEAARGAIDDSATVADTLGASLVLRHRSGASLAAGPLVHRIVPEGAVAEDLAAGGTVAGRAPLGRWFEAELIGEINAPWNEAAVTVLHGGRSTSALGRVYAHMLSRRLLFQVGGRRRLLSLLDSDPARSSRPEATQSLLVVGADVVAWSKPGAAVRGEMLDDTLTGPASRPAAITVGYRRYEVSTDTTPEFASILSLLPRGSVDEIATTMTAVSPRGRLGMALSAGLGRDTARQARMWRAQGALSWSPAELIRLELGYEEATEFASGLVGRRHTGWLSCHVDF